ncbi:IclR family transcriptional regulator [Nocardioides pacificus]
MAPAPHVTETSVAADPAIRSVARAADVLRLFDQNHPTRTLRDIVEATGLPKTTVVRLLATLSGLDLVADLRGEATYGLGAGFLRWVGLAGALWQVGEEATGHMRTLVDSCGETVNVYVRQDLGRVAIAQVEGTATVRSVVEVGVPYDLAAGAAAKVLLTGAPDHVVTAVAHQAGSEVDALRAELRGIEGAGFAVTHGERELGASAVAAPIVTAEGRVLAALSVSGPTSRFTPDRVGTYVDLVTAGAARISSAGLGPVEVLL